VCVQECGKTEKDARIRRYACGNKTACNNAQPMQRNHNASF
jgi:hypothetical protein